jgi:hypothetical protein
MRGDAAPRVEDAGETRELIDGPLPRRPSRAGAAAIASEHGAEEIT